MDTIDTLFRVIDTETAGFDGGICEAGYIDLTGGCISRYNSFITNPGMPISIEAMAVHHITEAMVFGKPSFSDISDRILSCTPPRIFVAHNAEFDKRMTGDQSQWVCTLKLCRHYYQDAPRHDLQFMRYWLKLDVNTPPNLNPHRALYDCWVTAALLHHIIKTFNPTLDEMFAITNSPSVIATMRYGEYKGQKIKELARTNPACLQWALDNIPDMDADCIHTINYWLSAPKAVPVEAGPANQL